MAYCCGFVFTVYVKLRKLVLYINYVLWFYPTDLLRHSTLLVKYCRPNLLTTVQCAGEIIIN